MYNVMYDTENFCDGYECPSIGQGKEDCLEIMIGWMSEHDWYGERMPTQEEIDEWDCMIDNCSAFVTEMPDDYSVEKYPDFSAFDNAVWLPEEKDLKMIWWEYWDEIKDEYEKMLKAREA